jgi:bacterioferritin-associated ferredoxin
MRVCHCHDVSDREIRHLAMEGVAHVDEVGEYCGAGTRCGGCRPEVERLVREGAIDAIRAAGRSSQLSNAS